MTDKAQPSRAQKAGTPFVPVACAAAFLILAGLAGCSAAGPVRAPDDTLFAEGTEGGTATVILDGHKVVFDRDAYAKERLSELAGDDDADVASALFPDDCATETKRLEQDLALRDALRQRSIAIESLDITIEGDRRRLRRCLRRVEPDT